MVVQNAARVIAKSIEDTTMPSSANEAAFRVSEVSIRNPDVVYALVPPDDFRQQHGIEEVYIQNGEDPTWQSMRFVRTGTHTPTDPVSERFRRASLFDSSSAGESEASREAFLRALTVILTAMSKGGIAKDPDVIKVETRGKAFLDDFRRGMVPFTSSLTEQDTPHGQQKLTQRPDLLGRPPRVAQPYSHTEAIIDRRVVASRKVREHEAKQVGPFPSLQDTINRLAGYTNESGETVRGSLLTEPDTELLQTIGDRSPGQLKENPVDAVSTMRGFLTLGLIDLRSSWSEPLTSGLHFQPPQWVSFERGKDPLPPPERSTEKMRSGGTLEVSGTDDQGMFDLTVDGKFVDIKIEPTQSDIHIQEVNRSEEATDGEESDTDFRPTFKITLTERMPGGEEETYDVWRVNDGILVQCSDSERPTFYKREMLAPGQATVTRKPVIYLYPQKPIDITVRLDYAGTLTNTYPRIDGNQWQVHSLPDGTLTIDSKKYKYLFWDGVNEQQDWDWSKGFCIHKDEVDDFLEEKTEKLGLNFAEAQDFITYWAPMMKQNEWSLVSFQTVKYEELAKLTITPIPDAVIRFFMVFKKVPHKYDIPEQELTHAKRKGFTVVEWGGSNLDELPVQTTDSNSFPLTHFRKKVVTF